MTLRQEIQTWADALAAYDKQDYESALRHFDLIAESSRIFFNIGLIYATTGQHEQAVANFHQACELDTYLAVAYFQCGVSNFLLEKYNEAERDFDDAHTYMRANMTIDYDQIGLKFRLYSCEILFNRGLSLIYMNRVDEGMALISTARSQKQTEEHGVIDEAFADRGANYTVFSIPVGVLYRPPDSKLKNLAPKNYLGQAKLIAATDEKDAFIGFTGSTRAKLDSMNKQQYTQNGPNLSRSKTIRDNVDLQTPKRRPSVDTAAGTRSGPSALVKGRSISLDETNRAGSTLPFKPLAAKPSVSKLAREPDIAKPLLPYNQPVPPLTPPQSNKGQDDTVLHELYDGYDDTAESLLFERPVSVAIQKPSENDSARRPVGQSQSRVAEWARKNAAPTISMYSTPNGATRQTTLRRGQGSARSNGQSGSGGGRTNLLRAPSAKYPADVGDNNSEEMFSVGSNGTEIVRIRIKLHYQNAIRGMCISPDLPHGDFVDLVCNKFKRDSLGLKFMDEDEHMIDILDEGDWESAVDCAREFAASKNRAESKLNIYVE